MISSKNILISLFLSLTFLKSSFAENSIHNIQKTTPLNVTIQEPPLEQKYIIEYNPLLLSNQAFGFNGEILILNSFALGSSLEYFYQTPYDRNFTTAIRTMTNIAPFVRYYFLSENQSGPFAGLKINFITSKSEIKDQTNSAFYSLFFVAPTAHFGYRFVNNYFTISAYAGAGMKLGGDNRFPSTSLPTACVNNQDWKNAVNKLNTRVSSIQPDYGLTLGVIF